MKRWLILLLCLCLTVGLTGCVNAGAEAGTDSSLSSDSDAAIAVSSETAAIESSSQAQTSSESTPPSNVGKTDKSSSVRPSSVPNKTASTSSFDYLESHPWVVSKETLLSVTPDMTYAEIIELLGNPQTCSMKRGFAQYIVDRTSPHLLLLFYDDADSVCGLSGAELWNSSFDFKDMKYDTASHTTDAVAIAIIGRYCLITCPWYPYFDFVEAGPSKDTEIVDAAGQPISWESFQVGDKIRITHVDDVSTCYPLKVGTTKIVKLQ